LHRLANDWLAAPTDPQSFVFRLQAVMALEGDELWVRSSIGSCTTRSKSSARSAGTSLLWRSARMGVSLPTEDYATKSDVERTPLLPAEPAELNGVG
jgi:hypothetical protein